jgi:hypothetical protein
VWCWYVARAASALGVRLAVTEMVSPLPHLALTSSFKKVLCLPEVLPL